MNVQNVLRKPGVTKLYSITKHISSCLLLEYPGKMNSIRIAGRGVRRCAGHESASW